MKKYTVGWLSLARYTAPLNATDHQKWLFLAENLDSELHVIAFSHTWRWQSFQEGATFYLLPYIPFAPLRYLSLVIGIFALVLWLCVRHRLNLIIAQSPYDGAIARFALLSVRPFGIKTRLAIEAHDDFANKLFLMRRVPFEAFVRRLLNQVARFSVQSANALRSVSLSTEKSLLQLAPTVPHVRFVAWTDSSAFEQSTRQTRYTDTQIFVFVGVITPVKGVHTLIEAFSHLPTETHLMLIGAEVVPAYSQTLRDTIAQLGLGSRVTWLGNLPQATVAEYLLQARALILPSQSEGLPRVILEAMICRTPVIATAVDGIPEVVIEGETGFLVPANDAEALAQACQKVLASNEATLERIAQNALVLAQSLFSKERYLAGYQRLITLAMES